MQENWLPVPGYPGFHASSIGRIRRDRDQKILRQDQGKRKIDYPRVILIPNKKRHGTIQPKTRVMVHKLVALAFVGECPDGFEHNHKNGIKNDNRPENLEFVTKSQNQRHSIDVLGNYTGRLGEQHGMSKLTETQVREIHRLRSEGVKLKNLAEQFHVTISRVCWICRGRVWTHLGLPDLGRMRITT